MWSLTTPLRTPSCVVFSGHVSTTPLSGTQEVPFRSFPVLLALFLPGEKGVHYSRGGVFAIKAPEDPAVNVMHEAAFLCILLDSAG